MAKNSKKSYRRSSGGSKGMFGLSSKGLLPLGLSGLGAAIVAAFAGPTVESMARQYVPQVPATGGVLGGFAIAGPLGAAAVFAKNALMGDSSSSGSNMNW